MVSKYLINKFSNHLNARLVLHSNGRFVFGCQMVPYWNGGLKTGLLKACLWSKMSGIGLVGHHMPLPFEYRTPIPFGIPMNSAFRCSVFRWLLYYSNHLNTRQVSYWNAPSKHVQLSNGLVFKWWSPNWTKCLFYGLKCQVFNDPLYQDLFLW